MISLLDVNVLVALFDAAHVHHRAAHHWMKENRSGGWATCPLTQNGCVRVMSQANYPGALPVRENVRRLRGATAAGDHVFWPDTISLLDQERFDFATVVTPRTLTDLYLLALAHANAGRLVTLDRSISIHRVSGAGPSNLVVL